MDLYLSQRRPVSKCLSPRCARRLTRLLLYRLLLIADLRRSPVRTVSAEISNTSRFSSLVAGVAGSTLQPWFRPTIRGPIRMAPCRRRFPTVHSLLQPLAGPGLSRPWASLTPELPYGWFDFGGVTYQRISTDRGRRWPESAT